MNEENVGTDTIEAVYVIKTREGTAVIPWDEVVDKIQRYTLELTHKDAAPVARGTVETYDLMRTLQHALYLRWERTGEKSVAELSPQLAGLEGSLVRAETKDGQVRVFTVSTSDDWQPHHIELRYAGDSAPAEREYERVQVIDRD